MTSPFYVVAPPYDGTSAGNRVLYRLATELERLGYEAYVVLREDHRPVMRALPPGEHVAYLTPERAAAHHRAGRTPIAVYPETSVELSPHCVRVFFLLNTLGALGGPREMPECEMVIAYSQNIAERYREAGHVIYVPVSDPAYWTPDPAALREGACVYLGKYFDTLGGELPAALADAKAIPRRGDHLPSRDNIRATLRQATALHVFENTALATEAALCGCPVVCHWNPDFTMLIAAREHGMEGFFEPHDDPVASDGGVFREAYLAAMGRVTGAVARFAHDAQRIAYGRRSTAPFAVRRARHDD